MLPTIDTVRALQGMSFSYVAASSLMAAQHPLSPPLDQFRKSAEATLTVFLGGPHTTQAYLREALELATSDPRPDSSETEEIIQRLESDPSWKNSLEYHLLESARSLDSLLVYLSYNGVNLLPHGNHWVQGALKVSGNTIIAAQRGLLSPNHEWLSLTIDELPFARRTRTFIKLNLIEFAGELIQKTEKDLLALRHCGPKTVDEIRRVIEAAGWKLGTDLKGVWP